MIRIRVSTKDLADRIRRLKMASSSICAAMQVNSVSWDACKEREANIKLQTEYCRKLYKDITGLTCIA